MASLTTVSILSRKIIRYTIYIVIFIILTRVSIIVVTAIYRRFVPPPPPPPTVCFGKLEKMPFPEKTTPSNLVFTLETATNDLPKFPTQLPVYFMPKAAASLQDLENARQKAQSLGFNPNGRELVENVYLFQNDRAPVTLNMNIVTGIFSVSYDVNSKPTVLDGVPPTTDIIAANAARSFLGRARSSPTDLIKGEVKSEYYMLKDSQFVKTDSLSDADVTKVNVYRQSYNDIKPIGPEPKEANIWIMLSGAQSGDDKIIAAEYHYFPIDDKSNCTYPLKTSQEAWEDLKSGKGFTADSGNNPSGTIVIRKVYLAYFDPGQYTQYYQPVVVFEGDNDFFSYVPAVTNEFYPTE